MPLILFSSDLRKEKLGSKETGVLIRASDFILSIVVRTKWIFIPPYRDPKGVSPFGRAVRQRLAQGLGQRPNLKYMKG